MTGRIIPTGIQDFSDLEAGNYLANIETFEEKMTKLANKLMFSVQLQIVQPPSRAKRKHFANFVIGTDEDPNADQVDTWQKSRGASEMKRFCKAAGVPMEGEPVDTVIAHVIKKNVCFRLDYDPGTGAKLGKMYANCKWAPEGTMEPQVDPTPLTGGEVTGGSAEFQQPIPIVPPGNGPQPTAPTPQVPVTPVPPPTPTVPPVNPTPGGTGSYPFPPPTTAA